MCVWVRKVFGVPAWSGPGTPVLHPSGVRLLPIEVAATYDLTYYRPDTTAPNAPEASRPRGGLGTTTTQEIKESTYFPLMLQLVARGYDLVGEPAPALPQQPPRTFPPNPVSRRTFYPFWLVGANGQRVEVPKIHTVILGVLGSIIPDSAMRTAYAAGASDSDLWRDLTAQLAADLHGSLSIPQQARRSAASSSAPLPQPQGGVG